MRESPWKRLEKKIAETRSFLLDAQDMAMRRMDQRDEWLVDCHMLSQISLVIQMLCCAVVWRLKIAAPVDVPKIA